MKTLFQLSEATKADQHHVTAFTRMNPPTTGHMQLIDKVHSVAKEHGADHSVVVSHSHDAKKNPLSSDQKKKHLKRFSSETNVVASSKEHPTILHHLSSLHKAGVTHAHIVAGSDRHDEMHKLTNAYNGKKAGHGYYKFKKITIHSAGERDPDAEDTSGVSATKQREHAASGNFKEFRKGVPSHVSDEHTKDLMNDVKNGQKTKKNEESEMESLDNLFEEFMIEDSESFSDAELWNVVDQTSFSDLDPNENDSDFIETLVGESIEEDLDESRVLSILQRQRAKMKFKQRQPRMKRMRELKRKRMATPQRLTYRARTSALMMLRKRIAGQKGLTYHKLPPSQRYAIDKAVHARYGKNLDKLVGTLSKRTLPMIRKKEMARLAKARGQKTSSIIGQQVMTQSYDVREDSDYISTNKDHLLTPKVNMLLRLGLVDQDEIERYRRALKIGEKALSSPELRGKILSMLDKTLKLATDDPQTFARIRAMVVLKRNSQNEQNSLEVNPLEIDPLEIDKMDPTPDEDHSHHLTLRKKIIRQHESKTFASLREKPKDQYDPLAEDKIAESLYNKSVKYNVSIDTVVEVYEAALKDSGNENVAFDAVNSFLANRELDEVRREDIDANSIFEIEMYVPEIHEARGDHLLTIQGGRGKGRKFAHKDTSVDDHLSAMEFHLKGYHDSKKSKLEATKNHHAKMYHKHKDQIEALGGVGNHLKESRGHKILAQKIQQIAIRKKMTDDALARHNAEKEKAEKEKKQGVVEGFPYDVDHMPGATKKHVNTNCTTCHGRKGMYKLDGKLFADNKVGAERVKCPTCKGTGDKQGVEEASDRMQRYGQQILKRARAARDAEANKEKPQTSTDTSSTSTRDLLQQLRRPNTKKKRVSEEGGAGVTEAKADPLGSWISHKEFTDPKIFKTREGAKAHAEKTGGTVNSSEGYHKLRKEKKQGVTEASTPYWKKLSFIKKMSQMAKQERREREKKEAEKKPVKEEGGAGEFGTPELTKKYAKDTPGQCQEILNMNTSDMGDVIKDFKKSDAPQFKGKSIEKRRQMAIAAKLSSQDKEQ
jgi:hypothetical protein